MRSFLERLLFPYLMYVAAEKRSLFPRPLPTAFIYTMNVDETRFAEMGWDRPVANIARVLATVFGAPSETLLACDTCQFDDYSLYLSTMFDPAAKSRSRLENFPRDCARARDLGARLVGGQ